MFESYKSSRINVSGSSPTATIGHQLQPCYRKLKRWVSINRLHIKPSHRCIVSLRPSCPSTTTGGCSRRWTVTQTPGPTITMVSTELSSNCPYAEPTSSTKHPGCGHPYQPISSQHEIDPCSRWSASPGWRTISQSSLNLSLTYFYDIPVKNSWRANWIYLMEINNNK